MVKDKITIVIVSYNTRDLLSSCIKSIVDCVKNPVEIIISDNGSSDGSRESIAKIDHKHHKLIWIDNRDNLGFAKGNNVAKSIATGKYVLFLNPDTLVKPNVVERVCEFLESNSDIAAATCEVLLPDGAADRDTRRSFPTPWVAITHFSYLDRLFPKSNLFSRYWYGYIDQNVDHEVEVIQGAFMMVRKKELDKVGWFDESYFLDGEDIDLCWKIHKLGKKLWYVPSAGSITHFKKGSKSKNKSVRTISAGAKAMKIFYKKRMAQNYPRLLNFLVLAAVDFLVFLRIAKFRLGI